MSNEQKVINSLCALLVLLIVVGAIFLSIMSSKLFEARRRLTTIENIVTEYEIVSAAIIEQNKSVHRVNKMAETLIGEFKEINNDLSTRLASCQSRK